MQTRRLHSALRVSADVEGHASNSQVGKIYTEEELVAHAHAIDELEKVVKESRQACKREREPSREKSSGPPLEKHHAGHISALTPSEFEEQAQLTRMQCEAELNHQGTAHNNVTGRTLILDKPINALPSNPNGKFDDGWRRLSVAVDSGVAETVIPYDEVKEYPVMATDASRSGLNYASATGDPIPNLGEQKLPLCT